jgi:hypothetical protein
MKPTSAKVIAGPRRDHTRVQDHHGDDQDDTVQRRDQLAHGETQAQRQHGDSHRDGDADVEQCGQYLLSSHAMTMARWPVSGDRPCRVNKEQHRHDQLAMSFSVVPGLSPHTPDQPHARRAP